MPIFMNYDGITGDVATKGHEQWIEVKSFTWGIGRGLTAASASESDREGATPAISEITLNKATDSASPNLFRASCGTGPVGEGKTVKIHFVKTDADQPEPYLEFELENTLISGWTMNSGGDRPSESVSLNFTKITMTNTPMGDDNDTGTPDRPFYHLGQQTGG